MPFMSERQVVKISKILRTQSKFKSTSFHRQGDEIIECPFDSFIDDLANLVDKEEGHGHPNSRLELQL